MTQVSIETGADNGHGIVYRLKLLTGYRSGEYVRTSGSEAPLTDIDPERLKTWASETGYEVIEPRSSAQPEHWALSAQHIEAGDDWHALEQCSGDAPYILDGDDFANNVAWIVADIPLNQISMPPGVPNFESTPEFEARLTSIRNAPTLERPILELTAQGEIKILDGFHRLRFYQETARASVSALVKCDVDALNRIKAQQEQGAMTETTNAKLFEQVSPALLNALDFLCDRLPENLVAREKQATLQSYQKLQELIAKKSSDPDEIRQTMLVAHQVIVENWANPDNSVGRHAVRAVNDLRTAITFVKHGLEAAGGALPSRRHPPQEIRSCKDNKLILALHRRAHAKDVLDNMDDSRTGSFYLLDTVTNTRHVSFAQNTQFKMNGSTPEAFFSALDAMLQAEQDEQNRLHQHHRESPRG